MTRAGVPEYASGWPPWPSWRIAGSISVPDLLLERFARRGHAIGGHLDVGFFPVRHSLGKRASANIGIRQSVDFFASPAIGFGASTTMSSGLSFFTEAEYSSNDSTTGTAAIAFGEIGIDAILGAGYRRRESPNAHSAHHQAVLTGGIAITLPFLAGIYCCILHESSQ